MLQVRYAKNAWQMNGLRIWIRLVVLSNFHVQSFFIRVTAYFILIYKDLNHYLGLFLFKEKYCFSMTSAVKVDQ